jgi:hypothetical protein
VRVVEDAGEDLPRLGAPEVGERQPLEVRVHRVAQVARDVLLQARAEVAAEPGEELLTATASRMTRMTFRERPHLVAGVEQRPMTRRSSPLTAFGVPSGGCSNSAFRNGMSSVSVKTSATAAPGCGDGGGHAPGVRAQEREEAGVHWRAT